MPKDEYARIVGQVGVSYIFTVLSFIFGPIAIILLTRSLSVAEYGIYSVLATTVAVLGTFLNLSLNMFIITKLPGQDYLKRIKSIASILLLELIFLVPLFAALFIPKINNGALALLKIGSYSSEFRLVLIIIFISVFCYLLTYYFAASRKVGLQSFSSFIYNHLWVLLLAVFFLIFRKINLRMVFSLWLSGLAISFMIILFCVRKEIAIFTKKIRAVSSKTMKTALIFSIPIIPASASGWVITFADRYMINYLKDQTLTGIYSLSYTLAMLILSFAMIISNVLHPYVSKAWSNKKGHHIFFNAMLKYNLIIIMPASIGLFVLREQIITLISGVAYLPGSTAIAILAFFPFFAFLTDIYSKNLALRDKTKVLAIVYTAGAALNIILNYFLIIPYGINGAAVSTLVSYFFMFSLFYIITKKQFSWDYNFLKTSRIVLASVLMGLIVHFMNPQIYITKILSIILGVAIYGILIIALGVFGKEEYSIIKQFVSQKFK